MEGLMVRTAREDMIRARAVNFCGWLVDQAGGDEGCLSRASPRVTSVGTS